MNYLCENAINVSILLNSYVFIVLNVEKIVKILILN